MNQNISEPNSSVKMCHMPNGLIGYEWIWMDLCIWLGYCTSMVWQPGGIIAREACEIASPQFPERLQTKALVKDRNHTSRGCHMTFQPGLEEHSEAAHSSPHLDFDFGRFWYTVLFGLVSRPDEKGMPRCSRVHLKLAGGATCGWAAELRTAGRLWACKRRLIRELLCCWLISVQAISLWEKSI